MTAEWIFHPFTMLIREFVALMMSTDHRCQCHSNVPDDGVNQQHHSTFERLEKHNFPELVKNLKDWIGVLISESLNFVSAVYESR
jgi:hypothetical protein